MHSVFKVAALTIYLGSSFITNSFIGSFIIIMMLLSADFWVVKNISGRLLAYVKIAISCMVSAHYVMIFHLAAACAGGAW